ncbi:MAG: potassium transporter TrkG [Roseovarius sp.]
MGARLLSLPLILVLTGLFALAMLLPALHALVAEDHSVAQAFFYSSVLGLAGVGMVGLAISGRRTRDNTDLQNLASLFLAYTVLPLYLALPFYEGLETTTLVNAYFEMVSSFTTTGATLFTTPGRLTDSLHLWRGIVGWMGGLVIWIAASAVLAPLNLGGFEVTASAEPGQGRGRDNQRLDRFRRASSSKRLMQVGAQLIPVYVGLTAAVWLMLTVSGDRPLVAVMHAMGVMATSGISPVGGVEGTSSGFAGEAILFLFMLFGLSRLTFSKDTVTSAQASLMNDPEFRIGLALTLGVPLLLFSRHWLGAYEVDEMENISEAVLALWGGMFTVLSFLSTTGFESASWEEARGWSGLGTPGLILLGLALVGGGVATTAGGVKLLRVYALFLAGRREMERLVHPNSMSGAGLTSRRIRREGAFIAWIFFMMFAMSLALIVVILSALGLGFENATVLAISALSTTGPLTQVAASAPIDLSQLGTPAKMVLCASMVLGRLETLAIIALFNPGLWRD